MNAIDRIVGWFDPAAGIKRHYQRQMLTRAYEAASPKDSWRPRRAGASANADHRADAAVIRSKARSLVQNVPYVRAGLDGLVSYTIGTGIVSRSVGREAQAFNEAFAAWAKVCDADGRLDWYGMQAAAYRAMEQDGEVLIRLRPRRPTDGLPIPLQLQLLEVDWLDTSKTGAIGNGQVVNGIQYDVLGRVEGYWLWDRHPGDVDIPRTARRESQYVPAAAIIHLFAPDRPGQGRGFSRLAPIIPRVRDLQLYEDAELARKNLESRLSVLASGNVADLADLPPGSQPASMSGDLGDLGGGNIIQLPPGMTTTVVEPKVAPGYVEYVTHQLHVIASGMGVPYEILTGDVSKTNFSSARVRILDFRRAVQSMQWLVLVPRFIEPVCRAVMDAARLAGVVRSADYTFDHSTTKWDYVNPQQDVESDMLEISAGLSSLSEKLRQRGYNPDAVFAEMQSDFQKLETAGILPLMLALQGKVMPGETAAAAQASRAAAPVVTINQGDVSVAGTTVQPPDVSVNVERSDVHVAAPVVNVEPAAVTVQPADVRVSVEPTPVTVEAPVVNVAPAEVRVDVQPTPVTVNTPRRRIDGMVERDDKGRVLRTTQIETDIPEAE